MKDVTPGPQQRNLILALVLSALILLAFDLASSWGWGKHLFGWRAEKVAQSDAQGAQTGSKPGTTLPQNDAQTAQNGAPVAAPVAALGAVKRIDLSNDVLHLGYNLVGGKLDQLTLDKFPAKVGQAGGEPLLSGEGPQGLWLDSGWQGSGITTPDSAATWQQTQATSTTLVLAYKNASGQTFERTLTLTPGSYAVAVSDRVWNTAQLPLTLRHYARVNHSGGADAADHSSWVNYSGPMGVAGGITREGKYSDIKKAGRTEAVGGADGWWGITKRYFATAVLPGQDSAGEASRDFRYDPAHGLEVYSAVVTRDVTVAPGGQAEVRYQLFAGPKQEDVLEAAGQGLERAIDWGWFAVIAKPLYRLLLWCHALLGNWGLAIFAVTLLLKLVTFPLANKSYRAMAKMKKLQPEIERLKAETPNQQEMAMKMMALYSREKVSPLGGCWPTLIQIPIFFAMYKVVLVAFEFRQAPLGLWIHDLSAQDPFYVLPVLMGMSMYVQMQLQPPSADPTQAMVFKWMPVMFTVMFLSFPAGLVLYWFINNVLSVAQQYYMLKKMHAV